jgi:hypothetical protein
MSRAPLAGAGSALCAHFPRAAKLLGVITVLLGLLPCTAAIAHEGNPNYRSEIESITPRASGVRVEVLNYDDRLLFVNRSGRTVVVRGYDGEPYVRLGRDGTVEVNKRSPAFYLNEDRFGEVEVPREADGKAKPRWEVVSGTGRYEWHDHRIHWMSKARPAQVKDEDKRTKVFDWRVPFVIGSQQGAITGKLTWEPDRSGTPAFAVLTLVGLAIVGAGFVLVRRRRRATGASRSK